MPTMQLTHPKTPKVRRLLRTAAAIGAVGAMLVGANPAVADPSASAAGSAAAGYNAVPSKVSGNVPSVGFEAQSYTEFGDEVALSANAKTLSSMSVVFSSWGCQSGTWHSNDCVSAPGARFTVPMTFTVYEDNAGTPGATLATVTQSVAFSYRPSASTECTAGKWFNSKDRTCYNGLPQIVSMPMPAVSLPTNVIWTVTYNTSHYGPSPIGETACFSTPGGCGYDSLNVGVFSYPNAPYSGTDTDADKVFLKNATFPAGTLDSGWTGNRPLGTIVVR